MRGVRAGIATVVAAALLAGCGALPGSGSQAGNAGTPAAAGGATSGPAGSSTAARPSPVTPTLPAAAVPGRKTVSLTQSGDLRCPNLVAPFTLGQNAELIALFGKDLATAEVDKLLKGVQNGKSVSKKSVKSSASSARSHIGYQLRAAAYQMNWVPMDAEVFYGEKLLEQMRAGGQIEPMDSESGPKLYKLANELLAETLAGVTEPHEYTFRALVTTDSGQNAQALPGGFVLIDPALLEDKKLARKARFAMAHEVGHVLQRHQTRALQARVLDVVSLRGAKADLVKALGQSGGDLKAIVSLALVGKVQFERFFGDQELHSDGCAVRILNRTQPSAAELVGVLQAFVSQLPKPKDGGKKEPRSGVPQGATSTASLQSAVHAATKDTDSVIDLVTRPIDRHPVNTERVDNLNATMKKLREEARLPDAKGGAAIDKKDPRGSAASVSTTVRRPAEGSEPAPKSRPKR